MTIRYFQCFDTNGWVDQLRELANAGRVIPTPHAKDRMKLRGITRRQIIRCLQKGRVSEGPAQETTGYIRASLEIVDSGEIIRVVAEIRESSGYYIAVITVINS